jgi:hypothetical protein
MKTTHQTTRRRRERQTTIYRWLRDRTSAIDYGLKHDGHPIHANRNQDVIEAFNSGRWLSRMTNAKFDAHFECLKTFYFAGNGKTRSGETLVMIDIDCHSAGTLEGALAFARFLREHHFPNLYFEVSTNGRGVHAYIIVEKFDLHAECVNALLKRLDQHLKTILAGTDFDVELVEVKGTCPVFVWGMEKGQLSNYKSGQLAKLPREHHRFDELQKTARIKSIDLFRLSPTENDCAPRPARLHSAAPDSAAVGSITGRVISQDELSQLRGHYAKVASLLLDNHQLRTTGRTVVTIQDVAIFLMLLRFFTQNMNVDGTLPQARFKGLWTALCDSDDLDRPCDDKRFAVIRNYLSSLGLLNWEDEHFVVGNGVRRGRACKWKASDLLMSMLRWESVETVEPVILSTSSVSSSTDREEERGTSLAGTHLLNTVRNLVRMPEHEAIRPVEVVDNTCWRINPDEIARYLTPLEVELGVAA